MDIRNWPMDRIMQLPDCCFGRRWLIRVSYMGTVAGITYDISEAALPERCVIWSAIYLSAASTTFLNFVSVALGDKLPASDAEFDEMETLFRQLGSIVLGRPTLLGTGRGVPLVLPMRVFCASAGRRLVGRFQTITTAQAQETFYILVSSIPTEVPDWLCSGRV